MDYPITKAFYIAASIFVTLAIFTGVILAIRELRNIYGYTNEIDNSISKKFESVVSQYSLARLNGVQLINTIKKFEDDPNVTVEYDGRLGLRKFIRNKEKYGTSLVVTVREEIEYLTNPDKRPKGSFNYLDEYDVTVNQEQEKITIKFSKIKKS